MKKKKVLFHQDNAPCHKLIATAAKLHELHFKLLLDPHYSQVGLLVGFYGISTLVGYLTPDFVICIYILLKTKNSDYNTLHMETPLLHPSSYTLT